MAFSPGGRRLAGASDDYTVPRWSVQAQPRPDLCNKLSTSTSHKQWHDWVTRDIGYQTVCPGAARPTQHRIETLYNLLIALEPDTETRPSRPLSRPLL